MVSRLRNGSLCWLVGLGFGVSSLAVLAFADSGSADGNIAISVTVAPQALSSTGGRAFVMSVRITNTGAATVVDLFVQGRPWPHAAPTLEGGPLAIGTATVDAPATFLPIPVAPIRALLQPFCVRGENYSDYRQFAVNVPARMATTLTVQLTALVPSWPGTNYTPKLTRSIPRGVGYFPSEIPIPVPPVTMKGPTGVQIRINTSPQTSFTTGTSVTITGTTNPTVRNALVRTTANRYYSASQPTTFQLGTARTNAAGRFRIRGWRPGLPGRYQLVSRIDNPGHGLQPDTACLAPLTVTPKPRRQVPRGRS